MADDGQNVAAQMLIQQLLGALAGPGRIPAVGGAGQNVFGILEQLQMGQQMLAAQQGSTPGLELELLNASQGFSKLAGIPFDPEKAAAQIHRSIGIIKPLLSALGQMSPQALRMIGPGAEQMVFAGDITQALYHQGMTGERAAEIGTAFRGAMGPSGRGFSGMGLMELGQMATVGSAQGWGPTDLTKAGMITWGKQHAGGLAAIRDVTGIQNVAQQKEMLDRLTLGGVGMSFDERGMFVRQLSRTGQMGNISLDRLGGIASVAGQYAQQVGGDIGFGREAAMHAAGLGAAMMRSGAMQENLNMANMSQEEFLQRDAMSTVNARMSRGFNQMAATVRLDASFEFKKDSQAKAMSDAIKGGKSKYMFNGREFDALEGDWHAIMEAGGVDRETAASSLAAPAANAMYGDEYNIASLAREKQWNEDVKTPLVNAIASRIRIEGAEGQRYGGVIAETMRGFQVKTGEGKLASHKRRREEVATALEAAGMAPEEAAIAAHRGEDATEAVAHRWGHPSAHGMLALLNPEREKEATQVKQQAEKKAKLDDTMSGYMQQGWIKQGMDAVKRAGMRSGITGVGGFLRDMFSVSKKEMRKTAEEAGVDTSGTSLREGAGAAADPAAERTKDAVGKEAKDKQGMTKEPVKVVLAGPVELIITREGAELGPFPQQASTQNA